MHLIVMRHGEAGMHAVDAQRPLTPPGRKDVARVAEAIAAGAPAPEALWHSPYRRARESADIVARLLRQSGSPNLPMVMDESLTPEQDPMPVIRRLQSQPSDSTLMLVSHMPLVNVLCGLLVDGRAGGYPFATSQALVLETDYPAMASATVIRTFY
ncbi:MAG: histidine phosphatase family protein [Oleiphilaceae bacterium]|nr:histidine phosphatase family protein [Oleiphilaceae bacterium]